MSWIEGRRASCLQGPMPSNGRKDPTLNRDGCKWPPISETNMRLYSLTNLETTEPFPFFVFFYEIMNFLSAACFHPPDGSAICQKDGL